jgi:hypothetical protein
MRTYTPNSPQAAARVVAMALLADGHLSMTELHAVDTLKVTRCLGLDASLFSTVLEGFCQDMLVSHRGPWTGSSQLDDQVRLDLLSEITHPEIQQQVMDLCTALIQSDGHVAANERLMLDALAGAWPCQMTAMDLRTTAPASFGVH